MLKEIVRSWLFFSLSLAPGHEVNSFAMLFASTMVCLFTTDLINGDHFIMY